MLGLTTRQQEAIDFVRKYLKENGGVSPSFEEIRQGIGLRSKSGVNRIIEGLERRGYLTRARGRARSIQLSDPENCSVALSPGAATALRHYARIEGLTISAAASQIIRDHLEAV